MISFRERLDENIHTNGGNNWWKSGLLKKYTQGILPR